MKLETAAPVKSADRVLDILEAVAASAGRASFSSLMSELAIPRSSLFQLLGNLAARGYLEQDSATLRYHLGKKIGDLAKQRPAPSLEQIVQPLLDRLSRETRETAGFYVREGDYVTTIATQTGGQALTYTMLVSEKAPLYAISSGKIALSRMRNAEVKAYLARTKFERFTPHTLSSAKQVLDELPSIRKDGFAYAREEFTVGIIGIGTGVVLEGQLAGMLNLAVPSARFTKTAEQDFRKLLKRNANDIAIAIGELKAR